MSNEEKQIEEMANITRVWCEIDNSCGSCHWETCNECLAECLVKAGYRKASDVAREIFAEIDSLFKRYQVNTYDGHYYNTAMKEEYAELKKKYESEGGE